MVTERESALLTDLYQLNMDQAYLEHGETATAVFEFFVRTLPARRGFLLAAGFDSRGLVRVKLGQWDAAIADYNAALRLDHDLPSALYGRGLARLKTGSQAAGRADIAAAKRGDQKIADEFVRYGVQ